MNNGQFDISKLSDDELNELIKKVNKEQESRKKTKWNVFSETGINDIDFDLGLFDINKNVKYANEDYVYTLWLNRKSLPSQRLEKAICAICDVIIGNYTIGITYHRDADGPILQAKIFNAGHSVVRQDAYQAMMNEIVDVCKKHFDENKVKEVVFKNSIESDEHFKRFGFDFNRPYESMKEYYDVQYAEKLAHEAKNKIEYTKNGIKYHISGENYDAMKQRMKEALDE